MDVRTAWGCADQRGPVPRHGVHDQAGGAGRTAGPANRHLNYFQAGTATIIKKLPPRDRLPDPPPTIIERQPPGPNPGPVIDPRPPIDPNGGRDIDIIPGPMQPVVKPPPSYPEACRSRGASGVVIVEFDVTAEGNVVNPRIISSADGCFDRAVLSTIQKYKYPPPQQDGRAVTQRGVREVFRFELEG